MNTDHPLFWYFAIPGFVIGVLLFGTGAFRIWLRAALLRARVSLPKIIMMRLRGEDASKIVDGLIVCTKSGTPATFRQLHQLYLSQPDSYIENVRRLVEEHLGTTEDPNQRPAANRRG